jgi:hypothetical protein
MKTMIPGHAYVIRYGDKYLTGCRHGNCPTWVYLSSKCVKCWAYLTHAQKAAQRIRVIGLYPGGPKLTVSVESVPIASVGRMPPGQELPCPIST